MKRIIFLLVIVILGSSSSAQDFRKVSWGVDKATVEESEPNQELTYGATELYETLSYTTSVLNLPAKISYLFDEDKLVKCHVDFTVEHSNDNDYIVDFDNIGRSLQSKYGDFERTDNWRNDLYKNDPSKHGYAISSGHYTIARQWENEGKMIILHELGGDWRIFHTILYSSVEYKSIYE